jgi:hypothetical protein
MSLEVVETHPKSQYLIMLEIYHIYSNIKIELTFNKLQYDAHNPVFDLI